MTVKRLGIVGSGIMGAGIAEVAAKAGYEVVLRSRAQGTADAMVAGLEKSLAKQVDRGKLDADDLVQETLLRAYRDLPRFTYRSPGSFMHWLSAIADHTIADAVRYAGRARRQGNEVRFRSESNPEGPEPADSVTPSRVLAQEERLGALVKKLDALPDHYREALLLAKIEGLTTEEIASRLGKTREAVSLLVFRAVRRFRELLEEEPGK